MTATRGLVVPHRVEPDPPPSQPDPWVRRFGATERFTHWWTVALLSAALLSGLGMGDDGGGPMLAVHVAAVVLLGAGLAGALTFGNRSAVLTATRRLFVLDRRDRDWLVGTVRHPLARRPAPEWGMFNAAQKLLAWLLSASVATVIGTGLQSWIAGGEGGLHGTFALVTVVLLGCHVFMAVVNPSTRPALRGMVRGYVSRPWAATHHAQWLRENDPR
jgi:formate dehydrogenase subunit gamma